MQKKSIFIISSIISIICYILFSFDAFFVIDNKFHDQQLQKNKPAKVASPIVILTIDDESFDKFNIWPWPRTIYSSLTRILTQGQAKVIGFDLNFDSHTSYNKADDLEFSQALSAAHNTVLATKFAQTRGEIKFLDPIEVLKKNSYLGLVHPQIDKDSIIRRYSLLTKLNQRFHPSFALQIISLYLNTPINNTTLKVADSSIYLKDLKIPLDKDGKLIINYLKSPHEFEIIPSIPISKVLEKDFLKFNPDIFKDKIVLIGATSQYLQDLYPTPIAKVMPGVFIHAQAINTIITQNFFHYIPHIFYFFLILASTIFTAFFSIRSKVFYSLSGLIAMIIGFILISNIAFSHLIIIDIFVITLAIALTYLASIILRFIHEEKEKKEIRGIFNQYVSPAIVNELLADKEKLKLGGDKKTVSVFFSDIRSFTTFSESHSPEEVISQLNEYLNAMTEVIFEFNGTLDKFVGDEIMAIWGSPLPQDDHALIAVRCALRQLEILKSLQEKWQREGRPVLDIGMGISTGEVIVGNIGAEKSKDFTVIGDVVNLGARLEAYTRVVTKERGKICHFIISDVTKKLVQNHIEVKDLGTINVKGKNKSVQIWEVLGEKH